MEKQSLSEGRRGNLGKRMRTRSSSADPQYGRSQLAAFERLLSCISCQNPESTGQRMTEGHHSCTSDPCRALAIATQIKHTPSPGLVKGKDFWGVWLHHFPSPLKPPCPQQLFLNWF